MQNSSARLNSCGVTVKPSAVWKSGMFQMKWGVQSSLSLFKLQLNILRIAAASSVRQQLGLFIDDFMRQSSKPDDDTDTKRSLLSGLILFSTEAGAVFLGRRSFFFFFFPCTQAYWRELKEIVIIRAMLAFMWNRFEEALWLDLEKARVHVRYQDVSICNLNVPGVTQAWGGM